MQQRFNNQSGVNIDTEMSNLIALQNAYGANARVMSTIQQMMNTLLQIATNRLIMSITGPGSITAANVTAQTNMMNQLNTLASGARHRAGGANLFRPAIASRPGAVAQCAALGDQRLYRTRPRPSGTTLNVAQSALTQLGSTANTVQQAVNDPPGFSLNSTGQTTIQVAAESQLDQILSLLNTQVGNNYIFSGSAVNQPSVASTSDILNGNGAQAGLTQIISEREQADLGRPAWAV